MGHVGIGRQHHTIITYIHFVRQVVEIRLHKRWWLYCQLGTIGQL